MIRRPQKSPLFPYTTLFRSGRSSRRRFAKCCQPAMLLAECEGDPPDRKSTRLNSSHRCISYAVFCLKKKKKNGFTRNRRRLRSFDERWLLHALLSVYKLSNL